MLNLDQCSLTGDDVALLMHSMSREPGEPRNLELHVSANRFDKGVSSIVKAIEGNHAPTHLFLRMIEYVKEDHFRQLLQALRKNTTIKCLDISKASLPYDAGEETCDTMRAVFEENKTLEDLDISGEQAHLEVARFGIGLNSALQGLKKNKTLKTLRIMYQNLGLEGANTLSSVIEADTGLTHIYCEHNDINLQGFTILVNALAKNYKILMLPFLQDDQNTSMKRMNADMTESRRTANAVKHDSHVKSSVRRTLTTFGVGNAKPPKPDLTPQDLDAAVRLLNERWQLQTTRLAQFLERNTNIAAGLPGFNINGEDMLNDETMRPATAMDEMGILDMARDNTTPKVELGNPVEGLVDGEKAPAIEEMKRLSLIDMGDEKLYRPRTASDTTPTKVRREKMFELGDTEGGKYVMDS